MARFAVALASALVLLLAAVSSANAAGVSFAVSQQPYPTTLRPGGTGTYSIVLTNIGSTASTGSITVTTTLPAGVTLTSAGDFWNWVCPTPAGESVVTCSTDLGALPSVAARAAAPALTIGVAVDPSAAGTGDTTVEVSGGGAPTVRTTSQTTISDADPTFAITRFTGGATDSSGARSTQAGAHPDVSTAITFPSTLDAGGLAIPVDNVKKIHVDLPPGLVGDPSATPKCTQAQLRGTGALGAAACPPETQVGTVDLDLGYGLPIAYPATGAAVYNMEPPEGVPGQFAFNLLGVIVPINASVRPDGEYALSADISEISQSLAFMGTRLTLWGIPADPIHDGERFNPTTQINGATSNATRLPFMTTPTACSGQPLVTRMTAVSWRNPNDVKSASFNSDSNGLPLIAENCGRLQFKPTFDLSVDAPAKRGAPAGISIKLGIPQNDNPDGLASAHLKKAAVALPEGMVVNPSSASGLSSCTPQQIGLNSNAAVTCPESSKIGSVQIDTPLLDEPLSGGVYLAAQRNNPFGTTLAMYLVAQGSGVTIKLPGRIDPDPKTGRVLATFDNNPQLPFDALTLSLKTGPRAPLSLPAQCGPATTTAELTPWSGTAPVTVTTAFTVSADGNGAACAPQGFAPSFVAGTANPAAGKDSPLTVAFGRTDDDQQLSSLSIDMPRGLLARIASTTLCDEASANAGTCGEASRIGSVTTTAGAGPNPFALPGQVYITGPYKGGPFGLSIVVPAVAGPFNLGTVVVRAAIFVDRDTAALRIVSDPMPTILEGIPLQIRLVEVKVDRPGFTFNPTSCAPTRVSGQISSIAGAIANVANRFQAGSCASLPFAPKMSLKVGAKGKLTRGKRTPLEVTLDMSKGQANNRSVQVTLPLAINARLDVVNKRRACSIEQFRADRCPMVVGTGTAVTPVLRDPLTGPAYFVYNPDRRLPDLVVRLKGQVDIDLVGKVTITKDLRLQTTFDTIPDAPITKFRLALASGSRNGPVGLTQNACLASTRKTLKADLAFVAQSNKRVKRTQQITVAGCGKAKRAKAKKK